MAPGVASARGRPGLRPAGPRPGTSPVPLGFLAAVAPLQLGCPVPCTAGVDGAVHVGVHGGDRLRRVRIGRDGGRSTVRVFAVAAVFLVFALRVVFDQDGEAAQPGMFSSVEQAQSSRPLRRRSSVVFRHVLCRRLSGRGPSRCWRRCRGRCSRRPRWPGRRAPALLRRWRRAWGEAGPDGRGAPKGSPHGPLQRKAGGRPRSTTTRGPGLGDRNCCHSIGSPQVVRPRRPPAARFGRAAQTRQPLGPLKRPSSTAPSPRPEPSTGSGRRRCTGSPESAARASGQEGKEGRGTPGLKRRAAAGRGGLPHTSLSRGHPGPTGKPRLRRRMRTKCPAWPTWPPRPAAWPPRPSACTSGRPAVEASRARGTGTGHAPQSAPRVTYRRSPRVSEERGQAAPTLTSTQA